MQLLLLGPLELLGQDAAPVTVSTRKRREVLALLGLNLNHVVTVDRLLMAVWGEQPPRQARSALQGHIAQLRKVLDADMRLATQESGYMLQTSPRSVDVYEFHQLVDQAREAEPARAVDMLHRALQLSRGEPLAGMEGAPLREAAAALEQDRLATLELLTERLGELGRAAETLSELQQAVLEHPFREPLTAALMLALYQDGRQAEALALFHRTRLRLAEELGIDPSARLRQAHESILRGSVTQAKPHRLGDDNVSPLRQPRPSPRGAVGGRGAGRRTRRHRPAGRPAGRTGPLPGSADPDRQRNLHVRPAGAGAGGVHGARIKGQPTDPPGAPTKRITEPVRKRSRLLWKWSSAIECGDSFTDNAGRASPARRRCCPTRRPLLEEGSKAALDPRQHLITQVAGAQEPGRGVACAARAG